MSVVNGQNKFRRRKWIPIILGTVQSDEAFMQDQQLWIPEDYINLHEAMCEWGKEKIPGWSGEEKQARNFIEPPDPPWCWQLSEANYEKPDTHIEYFIIDENDDKVIVSKEEATDWWAIVQPELQNEWREELKAYDRWIQCINEMRNALNKKTIVAYVFDHDGNYNSISAKTWGSEKAHDLFKFGNARFTFSNGKISRRYNGPVVLRSDFLTSPDALHFETLGSDIKRDLNIENYPYVEFMLRAIKEMPFKSETRVLKKTIESWLSDNWPENLGDKTNTKIKNMATFLRRPEDETGGIQGKGPDD